MFMQTLQNRYTCRSFNNEMNVSDADLETVHEAARISPSCFNLQHWKLLVIKGRDKKESIKHCFHMGKNSIMVSDSSILIIVLSKKAEILRAGTEYVSNIFNSLYEDELIRKHIYEGYAKKYPTDEDINNWSKRQCMLAVSNIVNCATSLSINSAIMEGFKEDPLSECINLDRNLYDPVVCIALGYAKPGKIKRATRIEMEELVEFL